MSSSFHVINYQSQQTIIQTLVILQTLLDYNNRKALRKIALLQVWAPDNFQLWAPSVLQPSGASSSYFDTTASTIYPLFFGYSQGALWFINKVYNSVSIYNMDGVLFTILSANTYNFSIPSAIASNGTNMYITNLGNNSVTVIPTNLPNPPYQPISVYNLVQNFTTIIGGSYNFSQPSAIAIDNLGNIWVANSGNNSITVFNNSSFALITNFPTGNCPSSIAFDNINNYMWVTNTADNTCTIYSQLFQSLVGTITLGLSEPSSIVFDSGNQYMWIVNTGNNTISIYNLSFTLVKTLENADPTVTYSFSSPTFIGYYNRSGRENIWVTNTGNNSITIINATHPSPDYTAQVLTTSPYFSSSTQTYTFSGPVSVIFDTNNNAYISNKTSNTINVINASTNNIYNELPFYAPIAQNFAAYNFFYPSCMAFDGINVWIVNGPYISGSVQPPTPLPPYNGVIPPYLTLVNATSKATINNYLALNEIGNYIKGIAFDGTNIWITNYNNSSVTIINTDTQLIFNTVDLPQYASPNYMAYDGTNMWITDINNPYIYVVNSTTLEVTTIISNISFNLNTIFSITFDGINMWVTNLMGNTVTVINATTFSLVANLTGFTSPTAMSFDGKNMWILNSASKFSVGAADSITVINTTTLDIVKNISDPSFNFGGIIDIAFDKTNMWVISGVSGTITVINAKTQDLVTNLNNGSYNNYNLSYPLSIIFDGSKMWITNIGNNSVTVINV